MPGLLTALLTSTPVLALQDEASKTLPRGPSDWTAKNWIGFVLYLVVFLAVVAFIFYIGRDEEDEAEDATSTAEQSP